MKLPGIQYNINYKDQPDFRSSHGYVARYQQAARQLGESQMNAAKVVNTEFANASYVKASAEMRQDVNILRGTLLDKEVFEPHEIPLEVEYNKYEKVQQPDGSFIDEERKYIPASEVRDQMLSNGMQGIRNKYYERGAHPLAKQKYMDDFDNKYKPAVQKEIITHNINMRKEDSNKIHDTARDEAIASRDPTSIMMLALSQLDEGYVTQGHVVQQTQAALGEADLGAFSDEILRATVPSDLRRIEEEINLGVSPIMFDQDENGDDVRVPSAMDTSQRQALNALMSRRKNELDEREEDMHIDNYSDIMGNAYAHTEKEMMGRVGNNEITPSQMIQWRAFINSPEARSNKVATDMRIKQYWAQFHSLREGESVRTFIQAARTKENTDMDINPGDLTKVHAALKQMSEYASNTADYKYVKDAIEKTFGIPNLLSGSAFYDTPAAHAAYAAWEDYQEGFNSMGPRFSPVDWWQENKDRYTVEQYKKKGELGEIARIKSVYPEYARFIVTTDSNVSEDGTMTAVKSIDKEALGRELINQYKAQLNTDQPMIGGVDGDLDNQYEFYMTETEFTNRWNYLFSSPIDRAWKAQDTYDLREHKWPEE